MSAAQAELSVSVGCSRPCPSCHLWTRRPSPSRSSTSSGTAGLLVWSSQRLSSHTSVQSTPTTSTATTSATTLTTGKQPGVFDGVCCSHTSLGFISTTMARTDGCYDLAAGTGLCTSCPCSAATTLAKFSRRSATLQSPSLTHTSGLSPLTQSARCRCPHCWSTVHPTPARSSLLRVAPCRLSAVSYLLSAVQHYMHYVLVLGCSGVHCYWSAWPMPAIFWRRQHRILLQH